MSGEWVRALAGRAEPVGGPLLGVARRAEGPVTLFDGMHRAAAWVAQARTGRIYPITVNVVVTERPAPAFEIRALPPPFDCDAARAAWRRCERVR